METRRVIGGRLTAIVLSCLIPAAATFAQQGSESDKRDWGAAVTANTVESLREYLAKHPNGKYAERVRSQILELERDAKRKPQDDKIAEAILRNSPGRRFVLQPELLGEEYKLWRSLTAPD